MTEGNQVLKVSMARSTHKDLKRLSVELDKPMNQIIVELVEEFIKANRDKLR